MKVLLIDDVHPALTEGLKKSGFQVDYRPDIDRAEALKIISEYEGLVVRSKTPIDQEFLCNGAALKWIARAGSGVENIDTTAAEKRGVAVLAASEGNANAVAEMATGLLLNMLRNITKANNEVSRWIWDREGNRGIELGSCTVGIWGFGNTGSAFAQKLSGFGCKVLAYDKYKQGFGNDKVQEVEEVVLIRNSDILSFHIPLNAETRHIIGYQLFARFEAPKYVMNLSRGAIANTQQLFEALENGKVKGCALDVLENENFNHLSPDQKSHYESLIKHPKVLITPHVAGWTIQSYHRLSEVLLEKINAFYGF